MANHGADEPRNSRRKARAKTPHTPHNVISIRTYPPEVFYECDAAGDQVENSPNMPATPAQNASGQGTEKDGPKDEWSRRPGSSVLSVSVPVVVRHHRDSPGPGTLEVGTISAGSLDLALNILTSLYPPASDGRAPVRCRVNLTSATAYSLHQKFCVDFLAPMDLTGGQIPVSRIRSWVLRHTKATKTGDS
jgi:hypothetical protein